MSFHFRTTPYALMLRSIGFGATGLKIHVLLCQLFLRETQYEHPLICDILTRLSTLLKENVYYETVIWNSYFSLHKDELSIVHLARNVGRVLQDCDLLDYVDEIKANTL
ncbi:hypothetical protein DPMN_110427 [Dreissena polymorpha]|uniref:Uncharacterized protein n=1 Tax=Dreissena polymorpha TaxID=45954 RepID=A0A9D4KCU0_DREPO|nr:hypothetical protein DPMN_110427 [Dreissena polymorpha]